MKTNKNNNGSRDEEPTVPFLAALWRLIFGGEKLEIKRPPKDEEDDKDDREKR